MPEKDITITGSSKRGIEYHTQVRDFDLTFDEPERLNGTNKGPNPLEYFLSAYSACYNMMGRMIAKEMDLKIGKIEVKVTGRLNTDALYGKMEEDRAGFKLITIELKPHTQEPKEKVDQWLDAIEKRCPIHDNLIQVTPVQVNLTVA